MCLGLNAPLTSQSIHVCSSVVSGILMLEMPMQIRLNKDQRRRAVMVKGQKRLCGPALPSTVPPVDSNNGCQHLTPKKHLSANSFCRPAGSFNASAGAQSGIKVLKIKVSKDAAVPCGSAGASSLFR